RFHRVLSTIATRPECIRVAAGGPSSTRRPVSSSVSPLHRLASACRAVLKPRGLLGNDLNWSRRPRPTLPLQFIPNPAIGTKQTRAQRGFWLPLENSSQQRVVAVPSANPLWS